MPTYHLEVHTYVIFDSIHDQRETICPSDTGDNTNQSSSPEEFHRISKNKKHVLTFSQNLRSEEKDKVLRRTELIPTFKNFNLRRFSVRLVR